MSIEKAELNKIAQRVMKARMRMLTEKGFFGLLLMNAIFAVDTELSTAATDGQRIYFGPEFVGKLNDDELQIVLLHEVMHIVLSHCFRQENRDPRLFNVACDIVVNSNIMKEMGLTAAIALNDFGELMHLAPDGREGHLFTAEQVYDMLVDNKNKSGGKGSSGKNGNSSSNSNTKDGNSDTQDGRNGNGKGGRGKGSAKDGYGETIDSHEMWGTLADGEYFEERWEQAAINAARTITVLESGNSYGFAAELASRLLKKLGEPKKNWREYLNSFVQEEVCDFSFTPPDRRYDGDFFLPDFNEKDESVKDVWFIIDTSGSMSDKDITDCYAEIKGAIEQFNGKLQGKLSFMESMTTDPIDFESVDDLLAIKPIGGGGTNFHSIFAYLSEKLIDNLPTSIVILTDGICSYPDESAALDIPVLWVITNDRVVPPWGKYTSLTNSDL